MTHPSPSRATGSRSNGRLAGPPCGWPPKSNHDPWQGHSNPSGSRSSVQPRWVHSPTSATHPLPSRTRTTGRRRPSARTRTNASSPNDGNAMRPLSMRPRTIGTSKHAGARSAPPNIVSALRRPIPTLETKVAGRCRKRQCCAFAARCVRSALTVISETRGAPRGRFPAALGTRPQFRRPRHRGDRSLLRWIVRARRAGRTPARQAVRR